MADPWLCNLQPSPTATKHAGGFTVFQVPRHLRDMSPEMFQVKLLQLGLQNRTLHCELQNLKVEIAEILHSKLRNSGSRIQSWAAFAEEVVGSPSEAKKKFQTCTAGMSNEAVQYHLALDALFIVFYFQYLDTEEFLNIQEFATLAKEREATLRSIELADFLLLENQIPTNFLRTAVQKLCEISPGGIPFNPEEELHKVLKQAVVTLQQFAEPEISRSVYSRWKGSLCCEEVMDASFLDAYLDTYHNIAPHCKAKLEDCKHILDCVYHVICGHLELPYACDSNTLNGVFLESIPSATNLQETGIKVKQARQWSMKSFKFEGSVIHSAHLELPKVTITETTGMEFRNLAIYEQLLGQDAIKQYCGDFRCYLECMSQLCRDKEDWQVLSGRGVLDMQARDEDVGNMWACSMQGVQRPIPTSSNWRDRYDEIQKHRRSCWGPWRRRNCGIFFGHGRWQWLTLIAAVVLLGMTALQTYFTVVNSASSKPIWPASGG